jgi:hypothetical protein
MAQRINKNVRLAVKRGTSYPAIVTDVVGTRASAKLSMGGATVHNLRVVGGPVDVGDVVNIDYTTPEPTIVAAGKIGLTESDLQKIIKGTSTGVNPKPSVSVGDMLKSTYDVDDDGIVDAAESITSGSSGDGYILIADGAGGSAFEIFPDHDHSGDAGDGGVFDAANLGSGAATDGYVLTADGVGGSAWEEPTTSGSSGDYAGWSVIVDGAGSVIGDGIKAYFEIPFDCELVRIRVGADASGSADIDIWKDTFANFPPTVGDTITASTPPSLSSEQTIEDTTLDGWGTTFSEGDWIGIFVENAATITMLTIAFRVLKT